LLSKFFVADVYRVDSGSMRPTLFGGRDRPDGPEEAEHVLVLYDRDQTPARFDLVVIHSPDGTKPLVKRVCGLPGDQGLRIHDGDIFLGRERLPTTVPRPPLIPLYDERLEPEEFFERRLDGSVRREQGAWVVDGAATPPGSLLSFHPELRDGYIDREGRYVPGLVEVNDARIELEFALSELCPGASVRLLLIEEGDVFQALVTLAEAGRASVELQRGLALPEGGSADPTRVTSIASAEASLAAGEQYDLALSNVDNHVRLSSRALRVELATSYAENRPWPVELSPGRRSRGPRVRFGAEGGTARFSGVRILRDLYYTQDGGLGCDEPLSLGPSDYFLLGDNSAASTDSRHFGPVKGSRFLGRPLAVVWPRMRWLEAVER
jgi:signal peptidase I